VESNAEWRTILAVDDGAAGTPILFL